jgi:hypothetical protein
MYTDYGCWENPLLYQEKYLCGFLYLVEGIDSDKSLGKAIDGVRSFINKHKLEGESS